MRQKGFTLVELLVAVAVGGIIIWGVVTTIFQVTWGTNRTNNQVVALTNVHHAALQIKKDLQMAQNADFSGGPAVTLSWTDYTSSFETLEPEDHSSGYELSGSDLRRTYDGTTGIVGRNIISIDVTEHPTNDRVIDVVITATEGDVTPRSETLEFSVYMRGGGLSE